jgi:meso-butanediol dehydrogenase/(S,S)-butanediol dehydrogenase/diacetyl reductase
MKLEGKVAIVTGAAGGLGRSIAMCLAEEGADVVIADIDMYGANKVAEEVRAFGRRALVVDADVTKEENAKQLVKDTLDAFAKIDILVNNVGAGHAEASIVDGNLTDQDWDRVYTGGVTELTEEDWDRSYTANLKTGIFMCKAVIPHMRARKSGKIINISSIAGRHGGASRLPYGAMKSGVIILTQGVATQVARDNINVNCICPGIIYTSIHEDMAKIRMRTDPQLKDVKEPREAFMHLVDRVPMGREQTPEDIGHLAVFLASEDARNITGQSINVDGGMIMS